MADVTVARAQREELLTLPTEVPAETVRRSLPALPRSLMILWAGLVLATAGLPGIRKAEDRRWNLMGRRMPAREIWSRFVGFLTDHGASEPWSCL